VADEADPDDVAPALSGTCATRRWSEGRCDFFVRLPDRDPLLPALPHPGFRQYATEQVVYAEKPSQRSSQYPDGLRPTKRGDDRKLYQLYRKSHSAGRFPVEAPTVPASGRRFTPAN